MNGHWLRKERERRGWTQEQAAARLGVSQTYLSLLENGNEAFCRSLLHVLMLRAGELFQPPITLDLFLKHLDDPNGLHLFLLNSEF